MSREWERAGDKSSRASLSLVYWFLPLPFFGRFALEVLGNGALVGGVSGVGCEEGGGSTVRFNSSLLSVAGTAVFSLVVVRFAAARAASGNSSEGSESVSI